MDIRQVLRQRRGPAPAATPAQERIAEELSWRWAVRSDLSVARHLLGGEEPDGVDGIWASTVTDRLFCWLDELGALGDLARMPGVGVKRQALPQRPAVRDASTR